MTRIAPSRTLDLLVCSRNLSFIHWPVLPMFTSSRTLAVAHTPHWRCNQQSYMSALCRTPSFLGFQVACFAQTGYSVWRCEHDLDFSGASNLLKPVWYTVYIWYHSVLFFLWRRYRKPASYCKIQFDDRWSLAKNYSTKTDHLCSVTSTSLECKGQQTFAMYPILTRWYARAIEAYYSLKMRVKKQCSFPADITSEFAAFIFWHNRLLHSLLSSVKHIIFT